MASICKQFKEHFPITKGAFDPKFTALPEEKFFTSHCWDLWQIPSQRLAEFGPIYDRTQNPLNETSALLDQTELRRVLF